MLAVIADDFTGAAEISGICLRFGLNVELETEVIPKEDIDILVIASDSRASSLESAGNKIAGISRELLDAGAELIFKKTDSVLRGHIIHELEQQMKICNKSKSLLVPANPSLGRKIKNGIYTIDDIPLDQTGFADDPEFPLLSANVMNILAESKYYQTSIIRKGETFHEDGIMVGEAISQSDLNYWAERIEETIVPAGAAGFFNAFLLSKGFLETDKPVSDPGPLPGRSLYLCGSAFSSSRNIISKMKEKKSFVFPMPDAVFYDYRGADSAFTSWTKRIAETIESEGKVIISMDQLVVKNIEFAKRLTKITAAAVEEILKLSRVDDIFVEGGATTSALVERLNFKRLKPVHEWSPGVIRMNVEDKEDLFITMKPGSYDWPKELWNFN